MPLVSVIIPTYNCASFLGAAIESVLSQTFTDWELVVVDDGSKDNTSEVVKPYLDRIRYHYQQNQGVCAARNHGIQDTSGEFLAFLDADDRWLPENLAQQLCRFSDPAVGMVYSDFTVHYSDGRILPSYLAPRPLATEGFIAENYMRSRFLFPSAMVLRRSAVTACGCFDETLRAGEDLELFTRIALRWKVARNDEPLLIRYEGTQNLTADPGRMNDYTILGFERILSREPDLAESTRRVLHGELAKQHWWRGYTNLQRGHHSEARGDLWKAMRYDSSHTRPALRSLFASLLPPALLKRVRPAQRS